MSCAFWLAIDSDWMPSCSWVCSAWSWVEAVFMLASTRPETPLCRLVVKRAVERAGRGHAVLGGADRRGIVRDVGEGGVDGGEPVGGVMSLACGARRDELSPAVPSCVRSIPFWVEEIP